jgi:Flp pilus assembly pilin Flp
MVQFIDAWLGLYAEQDPNSDQQAGQGLVEYALLIWFIAIVVFVAVIFLRDKINAVYSRIGNSVPN